MKHQERIEELEYVLECLDQVRSGEAAQRWITDRLATLRSHNSDDRPTIGALVARKTMPFTVGEVVESTMADVDRRSHVHLWARPMVMVLWQRGGQRDWEYVSDLNLVYRKDS